MDELDEDELFMVCLDDDGHPVLRTVADMTAGEVIAAINHLTVEAAGTARCGARKAGAAAAGRRVKAPQPA